jgi:hypothetical protein
MGSCHVSATLQDDDPDDFAGAFNAAKDQLAGAKPRAPGGDGNPPRPARAGVDPFEGSGVTPIGRGTAGHYHLLDSGGEIRRIGAKDMLHSSVLVDLWGGDDGWLAANFGYQPKKGDLVIQWDDAGKALMRACSRLGPWSPDINPPRRTGIWADAQGRPLLHLGDILLDADGRRSRSGIVVTRVVEERGDEGDLVERVVYVREPSRRRPQPPCSTDQVEDLRERIAGLWRFRDGPEAAMLILGWAAVASLGAAARWRPNLVVLGATFSGKSSLMAVLRGLLPIHAYSNDTSKAGLEGSVTDQPGPILVDEAAQGDRSGAAALFDMMLPASGGDGTVGSRGLAGGGKRSFSVLGAVCYGAIHPPPLKPEHMGRFSEIVLQQAEGDASDAIRAVQASAVALGPAFLGRAIAGFGRWPAALSAMRAAVVALGGSPREADQLGALLAGWWLMASDAAPSAAEAKALAAAVAPRFLGGRAALRDDSAGRRAWLHLATTDVRIGKGVDRALVGDLLSEALKPSASTEVNIQEGELRGIGMKPHRMSAADAVKYLRDPWSDDEVARLGGLPVQVVWFGRNHTALKRIFAHGDFAGDAWWRAMQDLPGARVSRGNFSIGKAYNSGAFCVPLATLELPEEGSAPPTPPVDTG